MSSLNLPPSGTIPVPEYFLIWLVEQLGSSLVINPNEVMDMMDNAKTKRILFLNDDRFRMIVQVEDK